MMVSPTWALLGAFPLTDCKTFPLEDPEDVAGLAEPEDPEDVAGLDEPADPEDVDGLDEPDEPVFGILLAAFCAAFTAPDITPPITFPISPPKGLPKIPAILSPQVLSNWWLSRQFPHSLHPPVHISIPLPCMIVFVEITEVFSLLWRRKALCDQPVSLLRHPCIG